ncbi:MAG TPA: GNAT family N-acetyltransferase [Thermomicrobiales bacterium]|nr:GNAT family N-acetyltransferase [Thermomicrobiales bacterium]
MTIDRLETSRLILRRPTVADIETIHAIHSDPRTLEHNPGDALASREEAIERFRRWDAHWDAENIGYFSVDLRDDDGTIGFCGVKLVTFQGQRVLNLFYRFDPRWWGQGYAGEAAGALLSFVERELSHLPLIAKVRPENVASHHIVARLGMVEQPALAEVGEDGYEQVYTLRWPERDGSL